MTRDIHKEKFINPPPTSPKKILYFTCQCIIHFGSFPWLKWCKFSRSWRTLPKWHRSYSTNLIFGDWFLSTNLPIKVCLEFFIGPCTSLYNIHFANYLFTSFNLFFPCRFFFFFVLLKLIKYIYIIKSFNFFINIFFSLFIIYNIIFYNIHYK